jgi:hypothetical protein
MFAALRRACPVPQWQTCNNQNNSIDHPRLALACTQFSIGFGGPAREVTWGKVGRVRTEICEAAYRGVGGLVLFGRRFTQLRQGDYAATRHTIQPRYMRVDLSITVIRDRI